LSGNAKPLVKGAKHCVSDVLEEFAVLPALWFIGMERLPFVVLSKTVGLTIDMLIKGTSIGREPYQQSSQVIDFDRCDRRLVHRWLAKMVS